ncbi:MAG TPA: argininosuccinate lyase, partial [Limnochordia bacterium]|nr:argininosuccinate lyase [Limnochordia bacterium]
DADAGRIEWSVADEDIHMNVERLLIERIGEAGKRLHTARSRNDQVAVDTRLFCKDAALGLDQAAQALQAALLAVAECEVETVLPGYTHLQRAQPILLAHHLLAYVEMLQRDRVRVAQAYHAADVCPLGSGALAGVTYPIDRAYVAEQLGFSRISANSLDAVSDRDYQLDLIYACSLVMMHLSRLCEELILWSTSEFAFIELDDAFATGSSIMPQKKNPDVAELARGKTGRVYGHLIGLLSVLKGLPLAYNKDLQEDKEALFDAVDTAGRCLEVLAPMIATLKVNRARMRSATLDGYLNATDLADWLVGRGTPFREAHRIVGEAVALAIREGKRLEALDADALRALSPELDETARTALAIDATLAAREVPGGTGPQAVRTALAEARSRSERFTPVATDL